MKSHIIFSMAYNIHVYFYNFRLNTKPIPLSAMNTYKYDLEDRLVSFAVMVLTLAEVLPKRRGIKNLANQLVRSGTAPALNYGEAQSAESPKDFLHKLRLCLKELRETQICLKIIRRKPYLELDIVDHVINECNELVAIFTASVETKRRNITKHKVKM